MENKDDYPIYGGCDTCIHQNEVCMNCMEQNSAGEWVHKLYRPKNGVYKIAPTATISSTTIGEPA